MLCVLPPSKKILNHITDRASEGDPFFLKDLQDSCAEGYTVSIDVRERLPNSYYWRLIIQAHPCVFEDFRQLWSEVQRTGEVPIRGTMKQGPLLRLCLMEGEVPSDAVIAGYVYFLSCNKSKKNIRGNGRRE